MPELSAVARAAWKWLFVCFTAARFAFACGRNVVALQQARIERTTRAAGLEPKDQKLGADTVHDWSGGHDPARVPGERWLTPLWGLS